jgi:hypothetical protein
MSKILFLTSSPITCRGGCFNEANGFAEKLKKSATNYRKALFITAFPDNYEDTDRFAEEIRYAALVTGIEFDIYNILDRRNENQVDTLVKNSNFLRNHNLVEHYSSDWLSCSVVSLMARLN